VKNVAPLSLALASPELAALFAAKNAVDAALAAVAGLPPAHLEALRLWSLEQLDRCRAEAEREPAKGDERRAAADLFFSFANLVSARQSDDGG
jgi:hypothetical protein